MCFKDLWQGPGHLSLVLWPACMLGAISASPRGWGSVGIGCPDWVLGLSAQWVLDPRILWVGHPAVPGSHGSGPLPTCVVGAGPMSPWGGGGSGGP